MMDNYSKISKLKTIFVAKKIGKLKKKSCTFFFNLQFFEKFLKELPL